MDLKGNPGGNVVPLTGFRTKMDVSQISEVRAYWEALRDGRAAPYRSEVDPRGIERALEYAFVLERIAPQVARFRLAGQHLGDLMGMEVRGMPLTSFFAPSARPEVAGTLERVFSGPCVAELTLETEAAQGRSPLSAKLLVLPLRSDLGDMSRALGCLVAEGAIGRAPRRFVIRAATLSAIPVVREEPGPKQHATAGFAEPPVRFSAAPPRAAEGRNRAHLRVVVPED